MDSRTIFLNACNEIAEALSPFGFKPIQNGQKVKKTAADKDLFFEIFFQSSTLNDKLNIDIIPQVSIYSKSLKKWEALQTKNKYSNGIIYTNHIGYVTPKANWTVWNLAGKHYKNSVSEISELLIRYVMPIFDILSTKESAVDFLQKNGPRFNEWTEPSLFPLNYLLSINEPKAAQKVFNDFLQRCTYKDRIVQLYKELKTAKDIDLNAAEFYWADKVKMAFVHGLKITK